MTGHLARSKLDISSYFKVPAPFLGYAISSGFLFGDIFSSQLRAQMTTCPECTEWAISSGYQPHLPLLVFFGDSSVRNFPGKSGTSPKVIYLHLCYTRYFKLNMYFITKEEDLHLRCFSGYSNLPWIISPLIVESIFYAISFINPCS